MYKLIRPLLFLLPPETAHKWVTTFLKCWVKLGLSAIPEKPVEVMGIKFPNPVGLAAGFDKNAKYMDAMALLGFGFIEVGTVTTTPQQGNSKPRLFRLPKHKALINRLGLNNVGVVEFCNNVQKNNYKGILGISISKNNATPIEAACEDYRNCLRAVYPYAHYIAIDLSCPNVPDFEKLLFGGSFEEILAGVAAEKQNCAATLGKYVPVAVKISPDLTEIQIKTVAELIMTHSYDAVIATNTTTTRPMEDPLAQEKGGLSGEPLFPLSLHTVQTLKKYLHPKIAIIAVGGIDSKEKAQQMFAAGASLIQLYTGLIYQGPGLVKAIVNL